MIESCGEVEKRKKKKNIPPAVGGLPVVLIACSAFHDFQLITGISCLAEAGLSQLQEGFCGYENFMSNNFQVKAREEYERRVKM